MSDKRDFENKYSRRLREGYVVALFSVKSSLSRALHARVLFLPAYSQLPEGSHHFHRPPLVFRYSEVYRVRAARFQSRQIARQIHNSFYNWEDSARSRAARRRFILG